ncbi:sterol desaturase family protein [Xylophilus sp. GW821-FHT01B05]
MHDLPDIILFALPAFALLIGVEIAYSFKVRSQLYASQDAWANVVMGLGNLVVALLSASAMLFFLSWLYQYRFFSIPTAVWWAWALCFLADDFSYYWFHRFSHEVRWFWASHSVHHSSERYNLSVALRQTWTGTISGTFLFWAWMPLIGFHPKMILFMQSASLMYQFWIHTQAVKRMPGWFEAIFNTPSQHRVHHGSNFEYLDKNYAGTLSIWDRMFGTFTPESVTPHFGLTKNIETFNPVRIAFHEWWGIAKDLKKARSVSDVFNYLFQPPGWSPDGSSQTTRQARKAAQ